MKTQIILIATALIMTSPASDIVSSIDNNNVEKVSGTQVAGFSFLRTHRQGKGVTATWGLSSNNGVAGFLVQKTYNDPADPYASWEDVASVPCTLSRSFKHSDMNVWPGYIYYRVIAMMTDGSTVTSEVSEVRIVSH